MRKVIEVLLEKTDDNVIYRIFDEKYEKGKSPYKFYVRSLAAGYPNYKTQKGFLNRYAPGWVVQLNEDNSIIGQINREVISDKVFLSFDLEINTHRKAFLELVNKFIAENIFYGANLVNKRIYTPEGILQEDVKVKVPKREKTLILHQKVWKIIKEMKNESVTAYENSEVDTIEKYNFGDFRARINKELDLDYSEKTISRIIEEGEAGVLD